MRVEVIVTTDAATEPVTLAEAKEHLRVSGTDEDAYITSLISAARRWCEGYLNRSITARTLTANFSDADGRENEFTLPYPPIATVTSMTEYTYAGTSTVITDFENAGASQERLRLSVGYAIPSDTLYEVVYTTSASAANEAIKQALLVLISTMYENRVSADSAAFGTVKSILQPFRIVPI